MCGRFSLGVDTDRLIAEFGIGAVAVEHQPRYNIAPGQPVPAVILTDEGLRLGAIRWGLVPSWAADRTPLRPHINARSETAATTPAFRNAFRRRRCWILADGFYEWSKGPGPRRVPFHFRRPDGAPFAMAGLWERAETPDGELVTCTILTTAANEQVRPIHDRMPVLLDRSRRGAWLDDGADADTLLSLLHPWAGPLESRQVSTRVNSPQNDDPACVAPVSTESSAP